MPRLAARLEVAPLVTLSGIHAHVAYGDPSTDIAFVAASLCIVECHPAWTIVEEIDEDPSAPTGRIRVLAQVATIRRNRGWPEAQTLQSVREKISSVSSASLSQLAMGTVPLKQRLPTSEHMSKTCLVIVIQSSSSYSKCGDSVHVLPVWVLERTDLRCEALESDAKSTAITRDELMMGQIIMAMHSATSVYRAQCRALSSNRNLCEAFEGCSPYLALSKVSRLRQKTSSKMLRLIQVCVQRSAEDNIEPQTPLGNRSCASNVSTTWACLVGKVCMKSSVLGNGTKCTRYTFPAFAGLCTLEGSGVRCKSP
eukprot:4804200-Amphidinium_carterae.1